MGKILLVEDDPDSAAVLELFLTESAWEIELTVNPEDALTRLLAEMLAGTFCAVITDMFLPHSDGFELLKAARQQTDLNDVPFISITAYHTPELRMKALKAGFNAYLPKPLNRQKLLETLAELCPS